MEKWEMKEVSRYKNKKKSPFVGNKQIKERIKASEEPILIKLVMKLIRTYSRRWMLSY